MNIAEADNIKNKVLREMKQERQNEYLSTILEYIEFLRDDPDDPDNADYLLCILRDIGYLTMIGADIEESLLKNVRELFDFEIPDDRLDFLSSFIDFDDLRFETERYIAMDKRMTEPPRINEGLEKEELWEEIRRDLIDCGLELVFNGIDVMAVRYAYEFVFDKTQKHELGKKFLNAFFSKADEYLQYLYKYEKLFYPISDRIFRHLTDFVCMPKDDFCNLLQRIAARRESCVKENYYRRIISSEETEEIYYEVKQKFEEYPSTARVYFYKTALAAETLRAFILNICFAKNEAYFDNSGRRELLTFTDEKFDIDIPMIRAGEKLFGIYMLSPGVSGWGVRRDTIKSFLSNDPNFQGALFCSWKEYPTGELLVRFDNYKDRKQFEKLLESGKGDFIRLSCADICEQDQREEFLSLAVSSLMDEYESLKDTGNVVKLIIPGTPEWLENLSVYSPESAKELNQILGDAIPDQYDELEAAAASGDNLTEIKAEIKTGSVIFSFKTGSVIFSFNKDGIGTLEGDFVRPESVKVVLDDAVSGDIYLIRKDEDIEADIILKLNSYETLDNVRIENMKSVKTENLRLSIWR